MASNGINWGQLLGLAGGIGGSVLGASTQNGLNTASQNAARNSQQLYNFGASGPGSFGGAYTANPGGLGGNVNLNYGNLTGVNQNLQGLAQTLTNQAGTVNGAPLDVTNANQYLQSQLGNLQPYQGGYNSAFGQAAGALPGAAGNANNFYGAANTQLTAAGQDPSTYANGVYSNLTAQAKPWEDAQTAALQDSQFGKGQTGTSGGALQTQAFAQGLGTADLQRQITAQQMGQQQQAQAVSNAGSLSGAGNALLSNAFNNFNTTGASGANVNSAAFGQGNTNVGTQSQLATLPSYLQSLFLGNSASALGQQAGIQTQAGNLYSLGLGTNSANGNLLAGAAGQLSANANGQNTSQNPYGNLLQSIFGSAANASSGSSGAGGLGGLGSALSSLFGGGSSGGSYNGDTTGGTYNGGTFNGGAPLYDPSTGGYPSYSGNDQFNIGLDPSNPFNGAGGQAATQPGLGAAQDASNSSLSAANSALGGSGSYGSLGGAASGAFGLASGIQQGGALGGATAALGAQKLYSNVTGNNSLNGIAGGASNALGIYNGLKAGGVMGDSSAAVNAAQLGSRLGAFGGASGAVGAAAGYIAAPLALYGAINNYKSGATGSDALQGASAGAAIGSIVPGVGTIIGGAIGGAVGAIASAFGPGAKDPETVGVQKLIDTVGAHPDAAGQITSAVQNPYIAMAGLMDRHESTLPMYSQYGRLGEQKFTNDLVSKINATPGVTGMTSDQVYNNVVAPWVASMGKGWSGVGSTYAQVGQGLVKQMVTQYMNGSAQSSWKAVGGDSPFAKLPAFGTGSPAAAASPTRTIQPIPAFANATNLR